MRSQTDPRVSDVRSPVRVFIDGDAFVATRGLKELSPKRFDVAKTAASLVRPMCRDAARPPDQVQVFVPAIGAEAERVFQLLSDVDRVTLGADLFPNVFDALARPADLRVIAALGAGGPLPFAPFDALARSLRNVAPELERRFVKNLIALAPKHRDSRILIEEKPGRATLLNLEDMSARHRLKVMEKTLGPVDAEEGFGLAALAIGARAEDIRGQSRGPMVAGATIRFSEESFQFSMVGSLTACLGNLLESWRAPALEKQKSVYIAAPHAAVHAMVGERLTGRPWNDAPILGPDLIYGWAPVMTLVEMLAHADLPALFVHLGRYPAVHVVAAW